MRRSLRDLLLIVLGYVTVSYLILPTIWRHYEQYPALEGMPKTTENSLGFPGDPLNLAFIGSREEIIRAFSLAGWKPADRITIISSLSIAESVILNRSYPTAPVSSLYLWGRKQDLAFERPSSKSPRQRHHLRLWQSPISEKSGRPLWLGAATYDDSVGLNHFTGQLTHHISPDVDSERDAIIRSLASMGQIQSICQVTGVGANFIGRNAQGDWYYTDGELSVGIISSENRQITSQPQRIPNPIVIDWKNQSWQILRKLLSPYDTAEGKTLSPSQAR
jgi:hypothetical protein